MAQTASIRGGGAWTILEVEETGSSNDDLLAAASRGEVSNRTALRAGHQTAGRGRLDRRWDAPPGANLLTSLYLTGFDDRPGEAMQRVGVALVDGIESLRSRSGTNSDVAGPDEGSGAGSDAGSGAAAAAAGASVAGPERGVRPEIGLKWPNDVLLGGRKLSGVLAQRSSDVAGVVVGFGVNVGWSPPDAARLDEVLDCTLAELLTAVLDAFDALPVDRATFSTRYRECLLTLGQRVRIHLPAGGTFDGLATDLDADGRIEVTSDAGIVRLFDVGDVVHLRPG